MPFTHRTTDPSQMVEAVEAIEAIARANLNPGSLVLAQIAVLTIHPKSAKLMAKNASTATKKGTSANYVIPNNVESPQD